MKFLFVIDPLETLNPDTDTSYVLMEESKSRNIEVYYCTIQDLFFNRTIQAKVTNYVSEVETTIDLDALDIIFMRKEPPYDMDFHYATEFLSLTKTLVVNSPQALRDFNEKLITLNFPQFMPKTIVTSDHQDMLAFVKENKEVVVKELNTHQGVGVVKVTMSSLDPLSKLKPPLMLQQFLPTVTNGDKRVLILGGEFIGAVNRVAKKGYLSNFARSNIEKVSLTKKEQDIIKTLKPFLLKNNIHFAGLDFIDDKLTEINITCPTGVQQINKLEGINLEKKMIDYFLSLNGN